MNSVTVRAKTVIKLATSHSNIDINFQKGDHVEDMTMQLVHALVQNVGVNKAREILNEKLGKYKKDYAGLGK